MVNIEFNGKKITLNQATNIDNLIKEQQIKHNNIALICNDAVVPRTEWVNTQCRNGDKFVVFTMVAGG